MKITISFLLFCIFTSLETVSSTSQYFSKIRPHLTSSLIPSGIQISMHLLSQLERNKLFSLSTLTNASSTTSSASLNSPVILDQNNNFTEGIVTADIQVDDKKNATNQELIINSPLILHQFPYEFDSSFEEEHIDSISNLYSQHFPDIPNEVFEKQLNRLTRLQAILLNESKRQRIAQMHGFERTTLEYLSTTSRTRTGFAQLRTILLKIIQKNELRRNKSQRFVEEFLRELNKSKSELKRILMNTKPLIYAL